MLMSLSNLKTVCKLKGICTADLNRKGKDDLIKLIVNELKRNNAGDQKEQSCTEMFQLKTLHDIMMSSYLKPTSNRRFTKKMRSDNYKINLIYLKGNKYYKNP